MEMGQPDFWNDSENARKVSKQAAELRDELSIWEGFLKEVKDLEEVVVLAESEGDVSLHDEVAKKLETFDRKFVRLEFATLFSGVYDQRPAIVSIHAGSGGTEAQDWTEMLFRMYMRFAERHDWTTTILNESRAVDVGIKSITMRIEGRYAYGYLKSEAGVHRLVRISPFDAEKMRHTTFALVEVIPELDEVEEIELDPKDLRIDTFMAGGKGGQSVNTTYSAVRVVHIPTNISVACQNERSQLQNKETAIKILKSKLLQLQLQEQEKEKKELRGEYQSAEWGNQIRSYVLHPYKMVKDHRTEYETADTTSVLDGELEPFMEAYLKKEVEKSRKVGKGESG
ncbi:peptide chain release factor 2 [Candidatus Uhrbacteria bacterium]|nr:peptide chain release factor 2 [Candidatus Uhrbacteria bacterium]